MSEPVPPITPRLEPQVSVIVVTRDDDLTDLVCLALRRAQMVAFVARGQATALRLLLLKQPSAVIVDLGTGDTSQLAFLKVVRRHHWVLALTSDDPSDAGLEPGEWLRKPLSPQELVQRVKRLVSDTSPRFSSHGWTLHDLAQGRIPVPGKPAIELVVGFRTCRGGQFWGPQIEAAIAELALSCVRRLAAVASAATHLELVADVSPSSGVGEEGAAIDLTALALACGLDDATLAEQILAEAKQWVARCGLPGKVQVRVVGAHVAPPLQVADRGPELVQVATCSEPGPAARGAHDAVELGSRRSSELGGERRRISLMSAFVVGFAAVFIAAYMAFPILVGGDRTITVAGIAASPVSQPVVTSLSEPTTEPKPAAIIEDVRRQPITAAETQTAPASSNASLAPAVAPTAAPTRPSPTAPAARLPDPARRVVDFYRLLQQGDYDAISLILSPRMRQLVPWDPAQLRQRTPSGQLTVLRAEVVQSDLNFRDAIVAVEVNEQVPPPLAAQRKYVGTWHLVRGPAGWLLDEPEIHIE